MTNTNVLKVSPSVQCWRLSFSDPVPGGRRRGSYFRDLVNVLQVFSTGVLQGGKGEGRSVWEGSKGKEGRRVVLRGGEGSPEGEGSGEGGGGN